MKIVILDYATLGYDLDLTGAERYGEVIKYEKTSQAEASERLRDADIVIVNKVKMVREVLEGAKNLKLICETATGFDNIDIEYCKGRGILVANTPAYSSDCVAQVTVSMVCSLLTHLREYEDNVSSGEYTRGGNANCLVPVYHEISGKTWGIIGFGNIGRAVGKVAEAFGCKLLVNKRTKIEGYECVDLDTLLRESDIITIHCPLSDATRSMIGKRELSLMKRDAIIINVARGAIWDEGAVADAILEGKIGGMGCDVFSVEPLPNEHPFEKLYGLKNVSLTPHMAWGSFESRMRCFNTVLSNIKAYLDGAPTNIVNK
ncbi:MAG: hydroxyacid dehydrogenase [Ruminococcaceae bacterium]|nr:hydroxyacid dehydrogenase [Oscillospiraceae bacterium]